MKNTIILEDKKFHPGESLTSIIINDIVVATIALTSKTLDNCLWKAEMAFHQDGEIYVVDSLDYIRGSYQSFLRGYMDTLISISLKFVASSNSFDIKCSNIVDVLINQREKVFSQEKLFFKCNKISNIKGVSRYRVTVR